MSPINKYLFNFASTYSGGGKQILLSYLEFFNSNGGAHFILNSKLGEDVAERYTGNIIYFVSPSPFQRLYDDGRYLTEIMGNEDFDLFFSYGVPIYNC